MSITGDNNYFEDFNVGDTLIHQRGRTITEMDNHMFTSLVMNTAELHFNQAMIDRNPEAFVGGKRWSMAAWCSRSPSASRRRTPAKTRSPKSRWTTANTPIRCFMATRFSPNRPCWKKRTRIAPTAGW